MEMEQSDRKNIAKNTPLDSGNSHQITQPFRPRARLLQLLGDELIGNHRLAIFELVKNAYDADATNVFVNIHINSYDESTITITDDGEGMTLDVLESVWLVPGDDHRKAQRNEGRRTARYGRLPLGEKGLGRFAVHKLGNCIELITRAQGSDECVVDIDWRELIAESYLDQANVVINVRNPKLYSEDKTGTQITIRNLRTGWSRGEVRRLYNQMTSICSPFEEPSDFHTKLIVPGYESWIEDLPDVSEILNRAMWKFTFNADSDGFDWSYEFCKQPGLNLEGRKLEKSNDTLKIPVLIEKTNRTKTVADQSNFAEIGPVRGKFYVYDRDREIRQYVPNISIVETYLNESGGIRVYRDGIRVYNYGERGDDWLGLDLRRVNLPTLRISNNIILGEIHLSLDESKGLNEKTNREGFVENDVYTEFRRIVLGVLATLETERQIDKTRIRKLMKPDESSVGMGIAKPIQELRKALDQQGIRDKFEQYIVRIEEHYRDRQETLLAAGISGLNLAIIFHEVERGVRSLHRAITQGVDTETAVIQARDLVHLLDGFASLLRRNSRQGNSGKKLIRAAHQMNLLRFRHHSIRFVCPPLERDDLDFQSNFAFNLVLGALNNLIDNSLYWLSIRWPNQLDQNATPEKKLYIDILPDFHGGPAIIVADNGIGYRGDDPENLIRPFFTRKPEGMGLGLFYTNMVMELNEGDLVFPQPVEVEIPEEFDGAVSVLIFTGMN